MESFRAPKGVPEGARQAPEHGSCLPIWSFVFDSAFTLVSVQLLQIAGIFDFAYARVPCRFFLLLAEPYLWW